MLYAFCMEHPTSDIQIHALNGKKVASVRMLGNKEKLKWSQSEEELTIKLPATMPNYSAIAFEIKFKK